MRGQAVLALLVMSGCTALFGLRSAAVVDRDNDNVEDGDDNCPDVPNPDQSDFDGDLVGDRCDVCEDPSGADVDADGIIDGCDGCIGIGEDVDDDDIDDGCDRCIATGPDADADGINDACDPCVFESGLDVDNDTIDDACDQCIAAGVDADLDMIDDACDRCVTTSTADADNDGLLDACDACVARYAGDVCGACVNCGVCAGGSGYDEDEDGIDNGCDDCKIVNAGQSDSDGDDVGDVCDVSDGSDSESFDPFNAPAPYWYVQGSAPTYENGTAHVSAPPQTQTFMLYGRAADAFGVRLNFELPPAASDSAAVGVLVASSLAQPSTNAMLCAIVLGTNNAATLALRSVDGGVQSVLGTVTVPFSYADRHQLILRSEKFVVRCELWSRTTNTSVGELEGTLQSVTSNAWYAGLVVADGAAVLNGYSVVHEANVNQ